MILEAYSLRDTKAEVYAAPFFVPKEAFATRLLIELVKDKRSDLGKYPADFMLYRIGLYDTDTAKLESSEVELICSASSCLPKVDPRQLTLPAVPQAGEFVGEGPR